MATLLKGDCLEKMKSIPDKSVDLIICDLPYGCLTGGAGKEKTKRKERNSNDVIAGCAWDIKIDLDLFWEEIKRIRRNDHTPTIHFCNTKFGYDLIKSNEKEFRYDLVWSKSNGVGFLTANKMPLKSHEMIYVFSKLGANYNRVDIEGDFPKGGGGRSKSSVYPSLNNIPNIQTTKEGVRCVKTVIEIANKKEKGGHPTAKPIELYKWLISRYSNEGDVVLDPTFGSGNSGEACRELKRKYTGIEKDDKFFWKYVSKVDGSNI